MSVEGCEQTKKVISTIGLVIAALYKEVEKLPITDEAKNALVILKLRDILMKCGIVLQLDY